MKSLLPGKCPTCSLIHFVEPWLIFFFVMVGHLTRLMPLPHLTITKPKGKPTDPASPSSSVLLHLRCGCRCRTVAQSPWHNSNMDEFFCRRCRTPCISSSYTRSMLSAKGPKTLLMEQLNTTNNWLRFNSHTNSYK